MTRADRERELRADVRRLKAAVEAIHDRLHAGDIDAAHEMCECASGGGTVTIPGSTVEDAAAGMDFAAEFNALVDRHRVRACAIVLVPVEHRPGVVSLRMLGEVQACKVVEGQIRGKASLYMGDHAEPR